jgi:hypothetical protein
MGDSEAVTVDRLIVSFEKQARSCVQLGSPMYGQLLDCIINDVQAGGVFADVLADHEDDPESSALPLRLLAGLHRLVLDGRAPLLRHWYPSVGGSWDVQAAWLDVLTVVRGQATALRAALNQVPQTNEVSRSAALAGALLILVQRFPFPVRLFEIGASAGLNLRADHYQYRFNDSRWGPSDAGVIIDDAWRGRTPPTEVDLKIIERQGYDIAPIDTASDDARFTLLSYVWPDMTTRLQRLQAAIEVARRAPARLDRMPAALAVKRLRLAPNTLTVLWHSVMWHYLSRTEQQQTATELAALGATASTATPFVWLSLELRTPHPADQAQELPVRARCWPDDTDVLLGTSPAHGQPVTWR